MLKKLLFVTVVMLFTAVCVKGQPASLKFKTIDVRDSIAHPLSDSDEDGFGYSIHLHYPSEYSDKAVLEKLQYALIKRIVGEEHALLHPEKAISDFFEQWIEEYTTNPEEYPSYLIYTFWDTILYVNNELLQFLAVDMLVTEEGQLRDFEIIKLNLQTGDEYSRDDIFKPEEASQISKLLITEINNRLGIENSRLTADDVWTEDTRFSFLPQGAIFYYDDEIGDYELADPNFFIPFEQILPYLRTGTPVWNLANAQ